ncbi:MAG TPA: hypothetical protein VGA21_08920 [Cyclobacteriaceae bacterium]
MQVKIYPNPVYDRLHSELQIIANKDFTLEIFSLMGVGLIEGVEINENLVREIDVSNFSSVSVKITMKLISNVCHTSVFIG